MDDGLIMGSKSQFKRVNLMLDAQNADLTIHNKQLIEQVASLQLALDGLLEPLLKYDRGQITFRTVRDAMKNAQEESNKAKEILNVQQKNQKISKGI
jgi:hypothetical protein